MYFSLVGGGSSGATLASRLSENPLHSVLLIEAGSGYIPLTDIASLAAVGATYPGNFYYEAERQDFNCLGFSGNVSMLKTSI